MFVILVDYGVIEDNITEQDIFDFYQIDAKTYSVIVKIRHDQA